MGMFDTITCDKKWIDAAILKSKYSNLNLIRSSLPPDDNDFQTKSLDCSLEIYKITRAGYLNKVVNKYEKTEIKSEEKEADTDLPYGRTLMKFVSSKSLRQNFSGEIVFYSSFSDAEETFYLVNFKAKFLNGNVKSVVLFTCDRNSTKLEREERDRVWGEKQEKYEKSLVGRLNKYKIYRNFKNCLCRTTYKLGQALNKLQMYILRKL